MKEKEDEEEEEEAKKRSSSCCWCSYFCFWSWFLRPSDAALGCGGDGGSGKGDHILHYYSYYGVANGYDGRQVFPLLVVMVEVVVQALVGCHKCL